MIEKSAMPTAIINDAFRETEREDGQCDIEHCRAGINQPAGERADLLRAGYVVENGSRRELAPKLRHASHEVIHNHETGAENTGDDLTARQRGTENTQRNEEHAGKPQNQIRPNPVSKSIIDIAHRVNIIAQAGVHVTQIAHPRVQHHRQPQHNVEKKDSKILTKDYLCSSNRCGKQTFQSSQPFFFCHGAHGDEREDEDKVEPEVHVVKHVVHHALSAGFTHCLQDGLQPEALQPHGTGQQHPAERCAKEGPQLMAEDGVQRVKPALSAFNRLRISCHVRFEMVKFISRGGSFPQTHPPDWECDGIYGAWDNHERQ